MQGLKHYMFNALKRDEIKAELKTKKYDLLIIGGGITGAGILLDATSRGLSVVLIEKNDFASGTSSKSTKLIHGGLRYLKNFEFKLVKEVGKERAIAYNNAPHLVVPEKMILPIITNGSYSKFMTNIGLWIYDRLAGVKGQEKRKMLTKKQTLEIEPLLNKDSLLGSGYYAEYRTDDARLTLEIIKTAVNYKATAINYVNADSLEYSGETIIGANCTDILTNEPIQIIAKQVVNATGPWVDEIRTMDKSLNQKRLHLTKGVHIVVPHVKLPINNSIYFDTADKRMVFAIPRFEATYIGTTDTDFDGDKDNPGITSDDINYLLNAINSEFPSIKLNPSDIQSTWSGLRPLIHEEGKSPSELSRKDEIFVSPSGLITIAGGKLTGYRLMAKKVVDMVCSNLKVKHTCNTQNIKISGGEFDTPDLVNSFIFSIKSRLKTIGLDEKKAEYLVRTYGKKAQPIVEIFQKEQYENLCQAEAWFCLRYEMTISLIDFFERRTGKINFDSQNLSKEAKLVLPIFSSYLNWNEKKIKEEIERLDKEINKRLFFA